MGVKGVMPSASVWDGPAAGMALSPMLQVWSSSIPRAPGLCSSEAPGGGGVFPSSGRRDFPIRTLVGYSWTEEPALGTQS